tara:strand:+ start:1289 stop:1786 length:498 start_codon:yes stop_codon:yes gene_type:complete
MSYNINRYSEDSHSCDNSNHLFLFGRFSKYYQCARTEPLPPPPSRCNRCDNLSNDSVLNVFKLKKINKENHIASSLQNEFIKLQKGYELNSNNCKPNHNSSDRILSSVLKNNNIPSRGNSLKSTITKNRPGAMQYSGNGVDIKHNHYERYLLKKKGNIMSKRCFR